MVLRSVVGLGAITAALFGIYYQLILKSLLINAGYGRTSRVEGVNNEHCTKIPELQACEKMIHHHDSGLFYFACSTPESRTYWEPTTDRLVASNRSLTDYVAEFNPGTGKITHLKLNDFPTAVPLALHGMDVVTSKSNPSELLVFLVNHRPPTSGDARKVGADSVIELFTTHPGSGELTYVKTFEDPSVIITPNDVKGYGDGSFYFTNDHRTKLGIRRSLDLYFQLRGKSVGYCHKDTGCKMAYNGLRGANGIAEGPDGLIFVANNEVGEIYVLEKEDDHTLVLTDTLKTLLDMPMDNIAADEHNNLFIPAFPRALQLITEGFDNPEVRVPSVVLRLSRNTGAGQFYGEKFKIDKVFQDDGNLASGTTTAVWIPKENALYLTGVNSPWVTVCRIDGLQ